VLIVDTGPLVAVADASDPDHQRCLQLLESHRGPLVTTVFVIAEAGWLIRRQLDSTAEALLYRAISEAQLNVEELTGSDWARIADLVVIYADIGLDAADASVIAIAERLGQTTIATLDERDFRIVRPVNTESFHLQTGAHRRSATDIRSSRWRPRPDGRQLGGPPTAWKRSGVQFSIRRVSWVAAQLAGEARA
jgi:uncharacterized protein